MAIDPLHPAPERQIDLEDALRRPRLIGYARVSTEEQNLSRQLDALRAAGCDPIYTDKASGTRRDRPGLDECLAALRSGDVLVIHALDRLARSLAHLLAVVDDLARRGVGFRSITEPFLDTTSPHGTLVLQIFGAVGQFEAGLIKARVRQGVKSKIAANGGRWGRAKSLTAEQAAQATEWRAEGRSYEEIARLFGCARSSVWRVLNGRTRAEKKEGKP